jgi:3-hydroxyacyl-[acyl-carrier-protein] dehydratase
MNELRREVKQSMRSFFQLEPGRLVATFTFGPEFVGFRGHFPQRSVLPGVCKIQAILVMLQRHYKVRLRLEEVVVAKFFAPAAFDQPLNFDCCVVEEGAGLGVKTLVTSDDTKIAQIELKVGRGDNDAEGSRY